MAEKNYRFLKVSSRLFNVLAWLALLVGLVSTGVQFVNGTAPWNLKLNVALLSLFQAGLVFFLFGTISGMIHLLLNIEAKIK